MNPVSCSTAWLISFARARRPGASMSVAPIAAMSMPLASSRATAVSNAAISAAVSCLIQSVRCAISGPRQTWRPDTGRSVGATGAMPSIMHVTSNR
jgi:hypothetical protein